MKNVLVLGGGSSAYSTICLLSQAGFMVSLFTRVPSEWRNSISCQVYGSDHKVERSLFGSINKISNDLSELIFDADIAVICAPVHTYNFFLNKIVDTLHRRAKPLMIGTMYGQGGFNWMVESALKRTKFDCKVDYWAVGLLPWICRTKLYGQEGINYGPKKRNLIATSSGECFDILSSEFLPALSEKEFSSGEFCKADSFLSLTLSVDNQLIHPARSFCLGALSPEGWCSVDDIPFFYRDFDDFSAEMLFRLDSEYMLVKKAIALQFLDHKFTHMMDYLDLDIFSYGTPTGSIKSSFRESKTLWSIKPPVVNINNRWQLDFSHRFFKDDLFYGLDITKWFATKLGIDTPTLDSIRSWALAGMKQQNSLVNETSGTPSYYGFCCIDRNIL